MEIKKEEVKKLLIESWEAGFLVRDKEQQKLFHEKIPDDTKSRKRVITKMLKTKSKRNGGHGLF